mmetsp:Transcript_9219/g.16605  ORF Transcript_9219/g.16605 Transcript_9219/m.16605 type:complete len:226 (+) Transcript_9219:2050-2727(+)
MRLTFVSSLIPSVFSSKHRCASTTKNPFTNRSTFTRVTAKHFSFSVNSHLFSLSQPNLPSTCILIALATLVGLLVSTVIAKTDFIPIKRALDYSAAQRAFINQWIKLAVLFSIILPFLLLTIFWSTYQIQSLLGCYFIVLIIQLIAEPFASKRLCESSVAFVGFNFTSIRIWLLYYGLEGLKMNGLHRSLGYLGIQVVLVYWICNLIVLCSVVFPAITRKNEIKS